jgi:hypothetical protein
MKAITLWDPWASLMALGFKKVETRCWKTSYRGPIAIHAALRKPPYLGVSEYATRFQEEVEACLRERCGVSEDVRLQFRPGCVLAIGDLVAIEETSKVRADLTPREFIFGNYEDGRYAWFFENIRALPNPPYVKGNRMLWNWNAPQGVA